MMSSTQDRIYNVNASEQNLLKLSLENGLF